MRVPVTGQFFAEREAGENSTSLRSLFLRRWDGLGFGRAAGDDVVPVRGAALSSLLLDERAVVRVLFVDSARDRDECALLHAVRPVGVTAE